MDNEWWQTWEGFTYRLRSNTAIKKATTVAIIDTGADETVISERLAHRVNSDLYGIFKAICASDTILEGKYADVMIRELWSGVEIMMTVGVSDKPFSTDDLDDEGVETILGVDFLQETEMSLDFGY